MRTRQNMSRQLNNWNSSQDGLSRLVNCPLKNNCRRPPRLPLGWKVRKRKPHLEANLAIRKRSCWVTLLSYTTR